MSGLVVKVLKRSNVPFGLVLHFSNAVGSPSRYA